MGKEEISQIPRRTTRSLAASITANSNNIEETLAPINLSPTKFKDASGNMCKEESPQIPRRTTRSLAASMTNLTSAKETTQPISPSPPNLKDLRYGEEPISLDDLLSSVPARRAQVLELLRLLGPLNSPMLPLFVYGSASTGKTRTILQIFRHLGRPFIYSSCLSCYSPRILFESILNHLFLHRKNADNGYTSAKRCEKPSDFVNYLRQGLANVVDTLSKNLGRSSSHKMVEHDTGNMIYLIFDNLELVKSWDKSSTIVPFLFNLYDVLRMAEVGIIFISNASPDTYYSSTGYTEPMSILFPDYTEGDLRQIFTRNQSNPKLYSCFLDVVLRPFCRVTRRVDELTTVFASLFKTYCKPLSEAGVVPNEDIKRRLFSHLQPHILPFLNETFRVTSQSSLGVEANKDIAKQKANMRKQGVYESTEQIDFHMSISAKYLLISAFLASRNPATLDASLFDSTGGSDNRKRKRQVSQKSKEQKETAEQELLLKGPGTFPLERLLAIFQCITSVLDGTVDEEEQSSDGLGAEGGDGGLMSDVLLQLSSLCTANFISKGGSCPLDGSTRYRCTVREDMALKVARTLKFPLSKYLYRK